jgi:Na+/H+ antiporter NhaD/arsenite permease-like protein
MIVEIIITLSIIGIAAGRFPVLRMNRATIALVGAVAVVAAGGETLEEAFASLDLNTLTLVFGMMVLTINLRLSGFFSLVGRWITRPAHTPHRLLALIIVSSGVLSALFLNDTIVLMFTPLVTAIALDLDRDPIPYLVGLAVSANIGSAATIIGNPQNMLIGMASGIDFFRFLGILAVPSLAGLFVSWVFIVVIFRKEFTAVRFTVPEEGRGNVYTPLLVKSMIAAAVLFIAIFLKLPLAFAALLSAAVLLVTRRLKPERVFSEVDWSLLVLFAGLFILTDALRHDAGFGGILRRLIGFAEEGMPAFAAVSAVLSNIVSNVPAVMMLRSGVAGLPNTEQAWITLAMATTYAGNFTLLGSIANLIVAESAKKRGVRLGFWKYFLAGAPITVVTILIGSLWLQWFYRM